MKVKQLMSILAHCDPEARVCFEGWVGDGLFQMWVVAGLHSEPGNKILLIDDKERKR